MPETPEPTRNPHPPVPTTPKPTTSIPDIGTEDDDNTQPETSTTEKPTTESSTTESSTTESSTTGSSTTDSSTTEASTTESSTTESSTTEKPTTEKTTTSAPTDDDITDEEKDVKEDIKDVNEDGEMLVINKKRLLQESEDFPPKQNDTVITNFAKKAFNDTCNKNNFTYNFEKIKVEVVYRYENGSTNASYEISFGNIEFENTINNNNTWAKIEEELNGGSSSFYTSMTEFTDNSYTSCKVPDRLKDPTPCDYSKTYFEYVANQDAEDANVLPNKTNVNVTYSISCTRTFVTPNNTNGELKVSIKNKESTSYCNIKCSADNYRDNYNQLSFIIKDEKPSFTKVGTVVPVYQNSKENFTIIMKVTYPNGVKADEKQMTISNEGECKLIGNNKIKSTLSFEFKDLHYECPYTSTFTERITFEIDGIRTEYSILVVEKPEFVQTVTSADGATVEPEYKCEPQQSLDHYTNLCCERNEILGESCNSLKITFPFATTGNNNDNKLSLDFVDEYVNMLRKYAFDESNFNFTVSNPGNDKKIEIDVKFYSQKIFVYSAGNLIRRSLQQNMKWDELPTPYLYIQTVVSYIEPTAKSDQSTDEIENELPVVLKEAIGENNQVIENIKKVKNEAAVKAAQISASYDVSLDSDAGISVVPQVVETAYIPTQAENGELIITKKEKEKDSNWAKDNWWVILIICLVVVILIAVIGVVLYIKLSNKTSASSSKSISASKKDIEKSNKIMETVIPIEKIKQDNGVTEEDIYKPFSYEVIMEGYLMKAGHDRVIGKWQRRYCVLYYDPAILRIYDSMVPSLYGKVYLEEKQSIPLDCYNEIEYKEGSNEFTLILKVRESNLKTFEAGDTERKIQMKVEGENKVETAKRWVECFRDFKNQKPKPAEAWTRPLIMDESNNGKITTSTNKAAEKKNEQIISMFNERKQQAREANQENYV